MAVRDVGVKVFDFPAAHDVQKTAEGATGRDLDIETRERFGTAATARIKLAVHDHASVSVVLVEHLERKILVLVHQAAHLENQKNISVLIDRHLHVRRLALIVVSKPSAQTPNLVGQRGSFDRPTGHIDFVNALVANVTVAKVPEPMPVVMNQIAVIRLHGGWPKPQIEIEITRWSVVRLAPDTPAGLAAIAF